MPSGELTCVETSAWIEYLRNTSHPIVAVTRELVTAARVCLADVVVGELFQVVRVPRERAILEEVADTISVLSGTPATCEKRPGRSRQRPGLAAKPFT